MIRKIALSCCLITVVFSSSTALANTMVTDPRAAANRIRSGVLSEAKLDKKLMNMPSWLVQAGTKVFYDKQTCANASIARPFFVVKHADNCLDMIGTSEEDVKYLQSVFSEFYNYGERSIYRLITILHRHMMERLGLPTTKTLEQFRHMMEKTNKHGYPTLLSASQFTLYCRCVALGLYAVYWFDHSLS